MNFPSLPWPFARPDVSHDPPPRSRKASLSSLLSHYQTPGVFPPSARQGLILNRQTTRPMRLWDMWKYGAFVALKATAIAGDVLSHHIWGPRKKSWGIEMTVINSFMRDAGCHTSLVDISTIRTLMSLGGLVPLPSDALVTPVTFRVRRRHLRGILAEHDAKETGRRELSGEWVVGKRLWQRLQAEWKAARSVRAGVGHNNALHPSAPRQKERVILYLHGGAYYLSSAAAQRLITIPLSKYTDARVFALDYRLAPETHFPGPLHDATSAYLRLVDDLKIPPENIILAGDSAGGGLALALLMYLRDNGYPLPSGAILMCPWVDLTMSCDSWDSNAPYDVVPLCSPDDHLNPVSLYLGDKVQEYLAHPYVSPLFGDFKGLPPLLIQAGEAEVLRDEVTLLAHKASLAGVEVVHELYEDAIHIFHMYPFLDAAHRAFASCREFVRYILPRVQARSPRILDGAAEAVLEGEIDNEKARVVRGDGVETASGMRDVEHELYAHGGSTTEDEGEDVGDSETDTDDDPASQVEVEADEERLRVGAYPSWGRSRARQPSPAGSDDGTLEWDVSNLTHPPSCAPADGVQNAYPSLQRMHSALSIIVPRTNSSSTVSARQSRRNSATHRSMGLHALTSDVEECRGVTRSPPPSPSIRRSSVSHPDITSLIEQWAHNGPANQTVKYKPHASARAG